MTKLQEFESIREGFNRGFSMFSIDMTEEELREELSLETDHQEVIELTVAIYKKLKTCITDVANDIDTAIIKARNE